jgi:hypothetical protein
MNAYLKDGRLADVLALIQVLARDKWTKRWHSGLVELLRRGPQSGKDWTAIGTEHPELFRVLEPDEESKREQTIALIARIMQPRVHKPDGGLPKLEPLSSEETQELLNLAITLHDRALQRSQQWKTVTVPLVVAIIAAFGSISAAVVNIFKAPSPAPAINVTPTIVVPAEPPKALPSPAQESSKALPAPKEESVSEAQ